DADRRILGSRWPTLPVSCRRRVVVRTVVVPVILRRSIECALVPVAAILFAALGDGALSPQGDPRFHITSIAEQGSGVDGRRHVLLRGTFDGASDALAEATCNGRPTPAAIGRADRTSIDASI